MVRHAILFIPYLSLGSTQPSLPTLRHLNLLLLILHALLQLGIQYKHYLILSCRDGLKPQVSLMKSDCRGTLVDAYSISLVPLIYLFYIWALPSQPLA